MAHDEADDDKLYLYVAGGYGLRNDAGPHLLEATGHGNLCSSPLTFHDDGAAMLDENSSGQSKSYKEAMGSHAVYGVYNNVLYKWGGVGMSEQEGLNDGPMMPTRELVGRGDGIFLDANTAAREGGSTALECVRYKLSIKLLFITYVLYHIIVMITNDTDNIVPALP